MTIIRGHRTPPPGHCNGGFALAGLEQRRPDRDETEILNWIVRRPDCDSGTAVTLFARGEPSYYAQFATLAEIEAKAGSMMETVRFLIEICERWRAGLYPAWRYRPDQLPALDPDSLPWPVPASLARAEAKGEALDLAGWTEGFPPALYGR